MELGWRVPHVAEILIAPFDLSPAQRPALSLLTGLHHLGKFSRGFRQMMTDGTPQPNGRHVRTLSNVALRGAFCGPLDLPDLAPRRIEAANGA